VTSLRQARRRSRVAPVAPRVGFVGLLGAGNLGNDGSLEAMLAYLRAEYPDAAFDFLCSGPNQVTARYGVPAAHLRWCHAERPPGMIALVNKALRAPIGVIVDAFRTASWVRSHDVVIVPGMGVLETTLPVRAWHTPYSIFLVCASGRLWGTKVALVSVGASVIRQRVTRRLVTWAARLAYYRSFRDAFSKDAMRRMGVDTAADGVYPDLAFSLSVPYGVSAVAGAVGLGVMDYHGGNDDRQQADLVHASYVKTMKEFALWLVDAGRPVRMFTTDVHDEHVMYEVITYLRAQRPGLDRSQLIAEPVSSLTDLMQQMACVEIVVASRYHNVLCALKLAKPTLSVGYAAKFDALMAGAGLADFCQPARSVDLGRLIEQFTDLESRSAQLRQAIAERNAVIAGLLAHQFTTLSAHLFGAVELTLPACHKRVRTDAY
jgi:polysaccharide pyruvyl transferase WcaK-like protein